MLQRLNWIAGVALGISAVVGSSAEGFAQEYGQSRSSLPSQAPLAEIQMSLVVGGSGGCVGRCVRYRVVVEGTGTVRYEDLGTEPRTQSRARSIAVDEALALLNEFLAGGFTHSLTRYEGGPRAIRDGNHVSIGVRGGADGPAWDLTLRVGDYRKTVHMYLDFPSELAEVRDRLIQLGGPAAWTAR
jgi:hypothetical protein